MLFVPQQKFLFTLNDDTYLWCPAKKCKALSPALFILALKKVVRDTQVDREMDVSGRTTLLAYANAIVILGESKMELEWTVKKLIVKSKKKV